MTRQVERLCALLREANMRATFDAERDWTLPCHTCGAAGPRKLVTVGTYIADQPGNIRRGDEVRRSVCSGCDLPREVSL